MGQKRVTLLTIPSMVQELLVLLVVSPSLQSSRLLLVSGFFQPLCSSRDNYLSASAAVAYWNI